MGSSYGQVDICRIPLLHSICMTVYAVTLPLSYDDLYVTPTSVEVPLGSSYAQVFLISVYGFPMH